MLAKRFRHLHRVSLQNTEELQGIDDSFALEVIVGDNEGVGSVLADSADAGHPGVKFFGGIEIVVALMAGMVGLSLNQVS